jgi:hypothetical protein
MDKYRNNITLKALTLIVSNFILFEGEQYKQ